MSAITITNAGLNLLRDALDGANNAKITYVALGTSSTAPAVTDTLLGAETFRKAVSTYTNGASTGEILVSMYLGPNDDVGGNNCIRTNAYVAAYYAMRPDCDTVADFCARLDQRGKVNHQSTPASLKLK